MKLARSLALLAIGLSTAGSAPSSAAENSKVPPLPTPEQKTMAVLRDVGTALFSWLTDRIDEFPAEEQNRLLREARAAEQESGPRARGVYLWGWRPLRPLTHEEIVALLRPVGKEPYIAEIPPLDAWGNSLQVFGWPENVLNAEVFAIRSAGPNGKFEGPRYEVGSWASGAAGDDIVWADGFFVRWPQIGQGAESGP